MGGEPWCFTPAEIGGLTDRQIWEMYVRPHVERQRQARRGGRKGRREKPARLPTREEFVAMGVETFALPTDHLEREYDRWAASDEGTAALAREAAKKKKG